METVAKPIVVRTYLSNAPAKGAGMLAWAAIAVAALFSWMSWYDVLGGSSLLAATREQVFERHEIWRLLTAPWVHADPDHLMSNLPFLAGLVFLVAGYFGLAAFPVLTVFAGALIEGITLFFYPDRVSLVGASGMVYFLGSFWLTMYFLIERNRRSLAQRAIGCLGLALATLAPHSYEPRVSYAAHAVGFALGAVGALAMYPYLKAKIASAEVRALPVLDEEEPDLEHDEPIPLAASNF